MNRQPTPNPNHDPDPRLAAELDQALAPPAPPSPQSLNQRILGLTVGSDAVDDALAPAPLADQAELEARIAALTVDTPLLDEALAADSEPQAAGFDANRLVEAVAATTHGSASQAAAGKPSSQTDRDVVRQIGHDDAPAEVAPGPITAVLARINPEWIKHLRYAAAIVILAAELGITLVVTGIVRDARSLVFLERDLTRLAQYDAPNTPLDQELVQLGDRLEPVRSDVGGWQDELSALDEQVRAWERQELKPESQPGSTF